MTHVDLFSGIGGFKLAAQSSGFKTVCFSEIEPFCLRVLKKHWPSIPNVGDINHADFRPYAGATILTGGFPCQPFSTAGEMRGDEDDRHLWPAMLNAIKIVRPAWVVGENVIGITNMALADVIHDLEGAGYRARPFDISACAVGLHTLERHIWIIAESCEEGQWGMQREGISGIEAERQINELSLSVRSNPNFGNMPDLPAPYLLRSVKGFPNAVDRIGAVGNAFNPQVAEVILKAIAQIETIGRG